MIASGPAYPDSSTCEDAMAVVKKYSLEFSDNVMALLRKETPKELSNVQTLVTGSVTELCAAAAASAESMGYSPVILTSRLCCQASQAGSFLASIALDAAGKGKKLAVIAGGETVVKLTGSGLGGRNQELALAAAEQLSETDGVCLFSFGSDGTDGPTDAAGGYVDGETLKKLKAAGLSLQAVLDDNDSYHALSKVGGLIVTGPTGTNVNDVAVALVEG